jgi:hypothetical protein
LLTAVDPLRLLTAINPHLLPVDALGVLNLLHALLRPELLSFGVLPLDVHLLTLDPHLGTSLLTLDAHLLRPELLALGALRRLHALHHLGTELLSATATPVGIAATAMIAAATSAAGSLLLRGAATVRVAAADLGTAATATAVRASRDGRCDRERGNAGGKK